MFPTAPVKNPPPGLTLIPHLTTKVDCDNSYVYFDTNLVTDFLCQHVRNNVESVGVKCSEVCCVVFF
jgi:hypothetical protein